MATKKQRSKKKKRNPRKGVMPPGLRKYWAKKRAKKNPRRKKAKRNPRVKVRTRTITKYKYRTRTVKVYPKRRRRPRKSNPRRAKRTVRIQAPAGLGPKGLRKFRAMAAKAYGAPARIVKR